jgi:hypothetical protein
MGTGEGNCQRRTTVAKEPLSRSSPRDLSQRERCKSTIILSDLKAPPVSESGTLWGLGSICQQNA